MPHDLEQLEQQDDELFAMLWQMRWLAVPIMLLLLVLHHRSKRFSAYVSRSPSPSLSPMERAEKRDERGVKISPLNLSPTPPAPNFFERTASFDDKKSLFTESIIVPHMMYNKEVWRVTGLLLAHLKKTQGYPPSFGPMTFPFGNREYQVYADVKDRTRRGRAFFRARTESFLSYIFGPERVGKTWFVSSPNRSQEVFLPLLVGHTEGNRDVLLVQASLSGNDKLPEIPKFNSLGFIVPVCIFGASLKAVIADTDMAFPFIKHNVKMLPSQVIGSFHVDSSETTYEQACFWPQHRAFAELISQIREKFPDLAPHVKFHLPCEDYLIYAAELYKRGHLTLAAFGSLVGHILDAKDRYIPIAHQDAKLGSSNN